MRKTLFPLLLSLWLSNTLVAQDSTKFYVGINPLAPFTSITNEYTGLLLPLFTNLENGLAIAGGYHYSDKLTFETRLSMGTVNSLLATRQIHIGSYYTLKKVGKLKHNQIYLGAFVNVFGLHYRDTKTNYNSLIPYLAIGFRHQKKAFFYDIRLNQDIYAYTWSNLENSKASGEFHFTPYKKLSPVIPFLSFTIGYEF
jgi:hypothetical protein